MPNKFHFQQLPEQYNRYDQSNHTVQDHWDHFPEFGLVVKGPHLHKQNHHIHFYENSSEQKYIEQH